MDLYSDGSKSKKPPLPAIRRRFCSTTMVTMLLFVLTNTTSILLSSGAGAFLLRRYKPATVRLWAWDDSAALLDDLNATQSSLAVTRSQLADLHSRLAVANSLLHTLLATMSRRRHDVFPEVEHACVRFREEMVAYMNYTAGGECPSDEALVHRLVVNGCDPLPRRRCRTRSTPTTTTEKWRRDDDGAMSYSVDGVLAARPNGTVRVGLDIGGGGAFAARMRDRGVTVVPVHVGPARRLPFFDGTLDVVRWATAPETPIAGVAGEMEIELTLFDVYRVLRPGGLLWLDHFIVVSGERTFVPMIDRVGFKRVRWNSGKKKMVSALLEKPMA
uniref:Methyltransferase type 11 domain-containing protein n=1 Tax=Leersia perrieri TaxID=77586 RepID=A0A0D9X3S8_9ORYZ